MENFKSIISCPICQHSQLKFFGKIKSFFEESKIVFQIVSCTSCNHWCLSKIPDQKYLDELYSKRSRYEFDTNEKSSDKKKNFIKKNLDGIRTFPDHWIFLRMKDAKPGKFFDVSPGNYVLLKTFYEKGWKCEAFDLQSWSQIEGVYRNFEQIPKDYKDVLVMHDVLEHTPDPILFLKKYSILQKKNGQLFLAFPNTDSFRAKLFKSQWRMIVPPIHINYFSKKSSEILLEKCGYKPLSITSTSTVIKKKLIKNILKLPFNILRDILKLNFKIAINRIFETFIDILDLLSGDQLHIVAIKREN